MVTPREPRPTIQFIDEYCQLFQDLFAEVRSYEAFKLLHLGMVSEIKRKSLPAIAKAVGLDNPQGLQHFLSESPWQASKLCQRRIEVVLKVLNGARLILLIDESGDCKKGKQTDYVKRQYIGNVGKKENGIVCVTAYGLYRGMVLPLCFEVYKPKERLKPGDEYLTKPQIAARMIRMLKAMGFEFELVLADSLYGESKVNFVDVLDELKLPYILAIRSHHALWLPEDQQVYQQPWQSFTRTFSDGTSETRYMSEVIYGRRRKKQYWILTTDPETLPENSTSFVMVCAPAVKLSEIGDSYGFRTWIEYGLKQGKDILGWADFRVTDYRQIEKWWELVMSAFLLVSLFADAFNDSCLIAHQNFTHHRWWDHQKGWKNLLNNVRLIIQPLICFNWLNRWLEVYSIPSLQTGFEQLIKKMNLFTCPVVRQLHLLPIFSSA